MKFKLLAGIHNENGKIYNAKDQNNNIVDSKRELDLIFANKFGAIGERIRSRKVEDRPVPEPNPLLVKKHKGGGRWVVMNPSTEEPVHDGFLTKAEAAEMIGELI